MTKGSEGRGRGAVALVDVGGRGVDLLTLVGRVGINLNMANGILSSSCE